jgi:hypothetical protein
VTDEEDGLLLTWPSGSVRVHRGDRPGVQGMDLEGAHPVRIGDAVLGAP